MSAADPKVLQIIRAASQDCRAQGNTMAANELLDAVATVRELLEALTMVRDADEDCIRDHLTRMPPTARALIDAAISKATGGTT